LAAKISHQLSVWQQQLEQLEHSGPNKSQVQLLHHPKIWPALRIHIRTLLLLLISITVRTLNTTIPTTLLFTASLLTSPFESLQEAVSIPTTRTYSRTLYR